MSSTDSIDLTSGRVEGHSTSASISPVLSNNDSTVLVSTPGPSHCPISTSVNNATDRITPGHSTTNTIREQILNIIPPANSDHTPSTVYPISTISSPCPSSSSSALPAVLPTDSGYFQEKLNDAQNKFEKACRQIGILDQKIKDLEVRYKRAFKRKMNSFRYNLRLRLSVLTGVKMMYHHYASIKADDLHRLHSQRHSVLRQGVMSTTDTSSDVRLEL